MCTVTPNKAMKRTSLIVTSFAYAKESPTAVGRLSRRYELFSAKAKQ